MAHYLGGSGLPIFEPIERLISEDPLVKDAIERGITAADASHGRLEPAVDTYGYSDKNWQYSLGGIDVMFYEILSDPASRAANAAAGDATASVRLRLHDMYEWHPDESRNVPCLHSAMENMKMLGARDFWEEGVGVVRLGVPGHRIPL